MFPELAGTCPAGNPARVPGCGTEGDWAVFGQHDENGCCPISGQHDENACCPSTYGMNMGRKQGFEKIFFSVDISLFA